MAKHEPIAVIGSGCRLPGEASTPSKLWELLRQPRDLLRRINRFNPDGFYHLDGYHHGTTNVQESYLLSEDHRLFDPEFFNIKPVEASSIDPMQRILLETVYEALESAGETIEALQGSNTAFYVGVMAVDYQDLLLRDIDCLPTYFATGTSRSIIANRVSYFFDWHGPSMTIDTACSSSMIALHQAVQTLRSGDSRVAVAAGADLILGPEIYIAESKLNMLSPTGRSRMWDTNADGYARGEGFAAVVLKKLSDAVADHDHIECIIRETGTNQDGRTKGITMPSAVAQTSLIRDTYTKAGLDLNRMKDRPQFFEAHGTGTMAGDPVEAEAICNAFFGSDLNLSEPEILYVGSVKTVIGHTEGTAGLAGVLKASLAMQNRTIPANMLFESLSAAIEPFYKNLQIPVVAKPWPTLLPGCPRRVSVNSFGFGGSNAHAILESYDTIDSEVSTGLEPVVWSPFVFSAASESSLLANLAAFSTYLRTNESINLRDLAWTLHSRRSVHAVKTAFAALTVGSLSSKIEATIKEFEAGSSTSIGVQSTTGRKLILGVFTGQGAQWAVMGKQLIQNSSFVRDSICRLERSLAELPASDRPSWSLQDELVADAGSSRLNEAAVSQPLCTAIQIVLVELLRSAGVRFTAVVGHSSGEIAAAYAAGYLSASDAVRIAYYRGFHAHLARGVEGQSGAMLAVGTSLEDASNFCDLPDFNGCITVAAHNSSASVTLSGDKESIEAAKLIFDDEKVFARILKVDTAYHSHHMEPCALPYVQSLQACDITVQDPDPHCSWYSSVNGGTKMSKCEYLKDLYWKDNMVNSVRFASAIRSAATTREPFAMALEVGPHPVLKGSASETLQECQGFTVPYVGVLKRGTNDIEAFIDAIGMVWTHLGPTAVDLVGFDATVSHGKRPVLLKNLPAYSWNHEQAYWCESRKSRQFRGRMEPPNELIGAICDDGTENEIRWRNFLRPKEVPWLEGHQVQGQTVFPAAGYVSMALEASRHLVGKRPVHLIEVQDLVISRAITFDDNTTGVETLFALTNICGAYESDSTVTAAFTVYSSLSKDSMAIARVACGRLQVFFGEPSASALPCDPMTAPNMVDVDIDRFYGSLAKVGYGYSGPFRALSSMKRKQGLATGLVSRPVGERQQPTLMVHPALLDPAFQAILAGYCSPGDGRLWTLHLPTRIRCIRVNPSLCGLNPSQEVSYPFKAILIDSPATEICGDVDVYTDDGAHTIIQMEGLGMIAVAGATSADDRQFFSETVWDCAAPDGKIVVGDERASSKEIELALLCERLAYYYWRTLDISIPHDQRGRLETHHARLFETITHVIARVSEGNHQYAKDEWASDTYAQIQVLIRDHPESIDVKLMCAVGESLPAVIQGKTTMLEHMMQDDMLDEFYKRGLGFARYNGYLASMASQIAHRYPHMKVLEIGAGTGGATKNILHQLDKSFSSYTYTDISTGFFEKAQEIFKSYKNRMIFRPLDIEEDPAAQGFPLGSYDLVIASNVLHATRELGQTLKNVRSLLKPGGFLLLLEITCTEPIRLSFTMGGLPGWWLGAEDGRTLSPCISSAKWNSQLRRVGFSGVDSITPDHDPLPHPFSVIATQAVDECIHHIRMPLSAPSPEISESLVILGGETLKTSRIAEEVSSLIEQRFGSLALIETLEDLGSMDLLPRSTVLSLVDLDKPIFKTLTASKMDGMKKLFEQSRNVLWLTQGCRADEPYANATVGFCRAIASELPSIRLQLLDLDPRGKIDSRIVAETLLRLRLTDSWDVEEGLHPKRLWSTEPELSLVNEVLCIPRILPQLSLNSRLNSRRRLIVDEVSLDNSNVTIDICGESYILREVPQSKTNMTRAISEEVSMKVKYSTLSTIRITSAASLFVCIGHDIQTGETILALSQTNSSFISVPENWTFRCDIPDNREEQFLSSIARELLAKYLVTITPRNGILVLEEPDIILTNSIAHYTPHHAVYTKYITSDSGQFGSQWIRLHRRAPERDIRSKLPSNASLYVDLSRCVDSAKHASQVQKCLPKDCTILPTHELFLNEAMINSTYTQDSIIDTLKSCLTWTAAVMSDTTPIQTAAKIPLYDISTENTRRRWLRIVDWQVAKTVPVKIEPINPRLLFSKNKTYLLVGLTGEIGQSLCQWMVTNGAGCIVLTSRNPKIDRAWLDSIEAIGATVRVFAMDNTNREALHSVYKEISRTLPPIAGVANGAMVLRDKLFLDMTMGMMDTVLKPKVEGTRYLDELFKDSELDFFILFSSLASVLGNKGQSNYCAANTYMTSLAAQRRKRGCAASVINIGRIVGLGYLERVGQVVEDQLVKYGFMPISESDLHNMFAEAIWAGRPLSGRNAELITALRSVSDDEEVQVPWVSNPRFSHCITEHGEAETKNGTKTECTSTKTQLAIATSMAEACIKLQECFTSKLRIMLQLQSDRVITQTPLIELGVDSLIAVEVRGWFLKETNTDMPVLKVLNGASIEGLCTDAIGKIPRELLPNIAQNPEVSENSAQNIEMTLYQPTRDMVDTKVAPLSSILASESISRSSDDEVLDSRTSSSLYEPEEETKSVDDISPNTPFPIAEIQDRMSLAQSRFWFLKRYIDDQTAFNVTFYYRVKGKLRITDLERAVGIVGRRHHALRLCFSEDPATGDQLQGLLPLSSLHLEQKQIYNENDVIAEYDRLKKHKYDLQRGDTMKVILLSVSPSSNFLIFGYHHIIMDGVSFQIFLSELTKVYERTPLDAVRSQYLDFSLSQRKAMDAGKFEDSLDFWRKELAQPPPPLKLLSMSKVRVRQTMKLYGHHVSEARLEPELAARIRSRSREQQATPFHFYLAAFKVLLLRYSKTDDLCIGIADANRLDSDTMETIGLFLNLLPIRFKYIPTQDFSDAVKEARTKAYAALAHSDVPFDALLEAFEIPRSAAYSPLFQAFFDYRQGAQEESKFGNCQLQVQAAELGKTAYDISLDITEGSTGSFIVIKTQECLYTTEDTKTLLNSYFDLLEAYSTNPSLRLTEPRLFRQVEIEEGIELGRGLHYRTPHHRMNLQCTGLHPEFDWPKSLPHRIDDIALHYPDSIALKDGTGQPLTYNQMMSRVHAIATALLDAEIHDGSRIAVFQNPSSDWICSLLAILRVGAVYVPLDLRNPLPRLCAIVSCCQPTIILCDAATSDQVPSIRSHMTHVIDISTLQSSVQEPVSNQAVTENPAVILFTSGSTGVPKGIVLSHRNIRDEMEGYTKTWEIGTQVVLQQSAFTFDFSLDQIFSALTNGGTLYVVPKAIRGDPIEITKLIVAEGITYTKATPSEYSSWIRYGSSDLKRCSSWRFAFGGGESLTQRVIQDFRFLDLPQLRLFNSYGPAEASISTTKLEVLYRKNELDVHEEPIPAGYVLPHYSVYIVDEGLNPLPIGFSGEIVIGGAGVGIGYLNDKKLTKQKFLPDKFASPEMISKGWNRMYRTGDLGRMRRDGALLFEGRKDDDTQIKLRGIRIDLRDIESTLLKESTSALEAAIVSVRGEDNPFLVAHVVFYPNRTVQDQNRTLHHLLAGLPLPQYMCPVMVIPLERMPLTVHSKVDRLAVNALPLPSAPNSNMISVKLTSVESLLKKLWERTISKDSSQLFAIDKDTNFFNIGGNSLLLVKLQFLIHEAFDVTLPLSEMFDASRLGTLASKIENSVSALEIDWKAETRLLTKGLESENQANIPAVINIPDQGGRVVLLTGSTGYIGSRILRQLETDNAIAKIYCIAVRSTSGANNSPTVLESQKIISYSGDLADPTLGLSDGQFKELASTVHSIIHCGAKRSFWDNYHQLRAVNVHSTKALAEMARPRCIPICFISSGGVFRLADPVTNLAEEGSVGDFTPPTDGSNGYVASKWASEKYLGNAAQDWGIPVTVYRFRPSAEIASPRQEIYWEFLRYAKLLKALPALDDWRGDFDLIPASTVVQGISKAVIEGTVAVDSQNRTTNFVHYVSEVKLSTEEVLAFLNKHAGGLGFERLPPLMWVGKIKALGFGWIFANHDVEIHGGEEGRHTVLSSRR